MPGWPCQSSWIEVASLATALSSGVLGGPSASWFAGLPGVAGERVGDAAADRQHADQGGDHGQLGQDRLLALKAPSIVARRGFGHHRRRPGRRLRRVGLGDQLERQPHRGAPQERRLRLHPHLRVTRDTQREVQDLGSDRGTPTSRRDRSAVSFSLTGALPQLVSSTKCLPRQRPLRGDRGELGLQAEDPADLQVALRHRGRAGVDHGLGAHAEREGAASGLGARRRREHHHGGGLLVRVDLHLRRGDLPHSDAPSPTTCSLKPSTIVPRFRTVTSERAWPPGSTVSCGVSSCTIGIRHRCCALLIC